MFFYTLQMIFCLLHQFFEIQKVNYSLYKYIIKKKWSSAACLECWSAGVRTTKIILHMEYRIVLVYMYSVIKKIETLMTSSAMHMLYYQLCSLVQKGGRKKV